MRTVVWGVIASAMLVSGCSSSTKTPAASPVTSVQSSPTTANSSSADGSTPSAASSSPVRNDCPSTSPPPAGKVADGPDLRFYLPVCSYAVMPDDWLPNVRTITDSGAATDPAPSRLKDLDCSKLTALQAPDVAEDFSVASAQEQVAPPPPKNLLSTSDPVQVLVDSYRPGDAAKALEAIRGYATRCPQIRSAQLGAFAATVTADKIPGLGDDSVDLKTTMPKGSMYMSIEIVAVRVGDRVLFVGGDDKSGSMPRLMDLTTPLVKVMQQ